MSILILSYLYDSKNFSNHELLENIKDINGLSIINVNNVKNSDMKEAFEPNIKGTFYIYFMDKSNKYEGTLDNLAIIISILKDLNV